MPDHVPVYDKGAPGHVGGGIRGEVQGQSRYLFWLGHSTERYLREQFLHLVGVLFEGASIGVSTATGAMLLTVMR